MDNVDNPDDLPDLSDSDETYLFQPAFLLKSSQTSEQTQTIGTFLEIDFFCKIVKQN